MEQDPSPDAPAPSADVEALRGTPVSELTQLTPAASGALERLRRDVERFDLEYAAADGSRQRPVMIHRALFGSIERFFGCLLYTSDAADE